MRNLGRVRALPGRFCVGFLHKGGQQEEENHQHGQKQEPLGGMVQTTDSRQTGPHDVGSGTARRFCISWSSDGARSWFER